jgi:hypothetical protein
VLSDGWSNRSYFGSFLNQQIIKPIKNCLFPQSLTQPAASSGRPSQRSLPATKFRHSGQLEGMTETPIPFSETLIPNSPNGIVASITQDCASTTRSLKLPALMGDPFMTVYGELNR